MLLFSIYSNALSRSNNRGWSNLFPIITIKYKNHDSKFVGLLLSIYSNALSRSNNRDCSLRAQLCLSYHLLSVPWKTQCHQNRFRHKIVSSMDIIRIATLDIYGEGCQLCASLSYRTWFLDICLSINLRQNRLYYIDPDTFQNSKNAFLWWSISFLLSLCCPRSLSNSLSLSYFFQKTLFFCLFVSLSVCLCLSFCLSIYHIYIYISVSRTHTHTHILCPLSNSLFLSLSLHRFFFLIIIS